VEAVIPDESWVLGKPLYLPDIVAELIEFDLFGFAQHLTADQSLRRTASCLRSWIPYKTTTPLRTNLENASPF